MGRFYRATKTDFPSYLDALATSKPDYTAIESGLGAIEALPQDRPRAQEIIQGYEYEIDDLTKQVQASPKSLSRVQPRLNDLRNRIKNDYFYGELGAIKDRLTEAKEKEKQITDTLKDYPTLQSLALDQFRQKGIEPLSFDPSTGSRGKINVPLNVLKPLGPADFEKWQTTQKTNIKDRILKGTSAEQIAGNEFESILRVGELVGVTEDDALAMLVGSVPREALEAEQMVADLQGRRTDETQLLNEDGTPNTNTTWGKVIDSTMKQIARESFEGSNVKLTDQGKLIEARGKEQRKNIRFKDDLDGKDEKEAATTFVEKMKAVWEGDPDAFDTPESSEGGLPPIIRDDNWLAGFTINKKPILGIYKVQGQPPMIEYVDAEESSYSKEDIDFAKEAGKPVYVNKDGKKYVTKQKIARKPLDFETVENINIPLGVKQQIMREAIDKGVMDKATRRVTVTGPTTESTPAEKQPAKKKVPGLTE